MLVIIMTMRMMIGDDEDEYDKSDHDDGDDVKSDYDDEDNDLL